MQLFHIFNAYHIQNLVHMIIDVVHNFIFTYNFLDTKCFIFIYETEELDTSFTLSPLVTLWM